MRNIDTSQPKVIVGIIVIALVLGGAVAIATAHILMGLTTLYWDILWAPWLPDQTRKIALGAGGAAAFGFIGAVILKRSERPLHGAARFANEADIRRGGFRDREGLILGSTGGRYLRFGGPEHVIVYAPTRSGKGVGVVIPNLLNWGESLIVLDIKGENYAITAGYRHKQGQAVYCFDPVNAAGQTHRYNPLTYVRRDALYLVNDLQKIASILYPITDLKNAFWDESARKMFVAIATYIAITPSLPFTLGQVYRTMTGTPNIKKFLQAVVENGLSSGNPLPDTVVSAFNDLNAMSDDTRGGVMASVSNVLNVYGQNPLIDMATAESDFDLRKLRQDKMSIYVVIAPGDLDRLGRLINLLFQQVAQLCLDKLPASHEHSVLLLMDEFTAPGPVHSIAKGFAYFAGYKLRLLPIIQSPAQLAIAYGREGQHEIMSNCAVEVIFPPKDNPVARELSERLGYQTVQARSRSRAVGFSKRNDNESVSEQRRALMLPQELTQMPDTSALLIRAGMKPILCRKVRFYKEKVFKERANWPLPPIVTPQEAAARLAVQHAAQAQALRAQTAALSAEVKALKAEVPRRRLTDEELARKTPLTAQQVEHIRQEHAPPSSGDADGDLTETGKNLSKAVARDAFTTTSVAEEEHDDDRHRHQR